MAAEAGGSTMKAMNYLLLPLYAALVLFAVYRQFAANRVSNRTLLVIPALLAFGAFQTLSHAALGPADIALLALNATVGLGLGLWRGQTYRIWTDGDGFAWQKGTWMTAASWGVLIASRVVVAVGVTILGFNTAQLTGDLLGSLFVTFAAQNAVIWLRIPARPIIRASVTR